MPTPNRTLRLGVASVLSLTLAAAAAPVVADEHEMAWDDVLAAADGQKVDFYMWSGSDTINAYVDEYIGGKAAELGIELNRVPADAAEVVQKVLGEKQAGRDDDGSVDLIWINGENFSTGKQADLWSCGWAEGLPSRQYVDSPAVLTDFGTPVDGCESPWGQAQFAFVYDSARVDDPPSSMAELLEWIEANPGQFTYPAPPDFTGSVFVRHVLYHANGGFEDLLGPFDQAKFDEAAAKTWEVLNGIEPSLWRGGETYPQSKEELDNLFSNQEVAMTMTYGPAEVGVQVANGVFPETTRQFVFDHGTIGNNHFVTIPYNSPNKEASMAVADILLSPEAQLEKAAGAWGDYPVINASLTDLADAFASIEVPESVLPPDQLVVNANPELVPEYVTATEASWTENVLQQ